MTKPYTGGCACGAIRYEIASEPIFSNHCQCRQCQHKSGSGHGSYLSFVGRNDARISGTATQWEMIADSGKVKTRSFCSTCGAPVYQTYPAMPDVITIHAGSGPAWDTLDAALVKFDRMPPAP